LFNSAQNILALYSNAPNFTSEHENIETYKTYQKTTLTREVLRFVMYKHTQEAFPNGRVFFFNYKETKTKK
jgi:hypothetical protein